MKPTSIIFLIISVLLIIAGFVTVGVANRMGAAEGQILTETAGGDEDSHTVTYEYEKDNIQKIAVDVTNANINIIGGAAKPYVELINFFEGTYELTTTNRVLTVKDSVDLTSPEGIASFAMNFKGLRGIVNQLNSMSLEKTVNIYLTDAYPVNITECSLGEGNVSVTGNKTATDYTVEIGTGALLLKDVVTSSRLNTVIGEGTVTLDNCKLARFKCDIDKGSVKATAKLSKVEAHIKTGDFTLQSTEGLGVTAFSLICESGCVNLNGVDRGKMLKEENPTTENLISVIVEVGDIAISE